MFKTQRASVLTVGTGRGFVVDGGEDRYVLTAAHCMVSGSKQNLPPCIATAGAEELTYPKLLAPLGGSPWVWHSVYLWIQRQTLPCLAHPTGRLFRKRRSLTTL
jgi:hypothetical protein